MRRMPTMPSPSSARSAVSALATLLVALLGTASVATAQPSLARLTPTAIELARPITFDVGTSTIDPAGQAVLRAVAQLLAMNGAVTLEISAHTDSHGSESFNQRASQERADAVRAFLVTAGVPPGRLRAVGYGETVPLDTNSTAEGRERNRRIELTRTDRRP